MIEENYLTQIKKCITFIFIKEKDRYIPKGTGFFVGIKVEDKHIIYLVTAKHVLQSEIGNFYSEIYLRLNTHENTALLAQFFLNQNHLLIHPDKSVDIICTPCT